MKPQDFDQERWMSPTELATFVKEHWPIAFATAKAFRRRKELLKRQAQHKHHYENNRRY